MRPFIILMAALACCANSYAGGKDSTKIHSRADTASVSPAMAQLSALILRLDSAEKNIHYLIGNVVLADKVASLHLPAGYKYIDRDQSRFILESLWKNLPDEKVQGMLVSDSFHVNSPKDAWAFVISYDEMGYVKDNDADKIKYNELLDEMKKDAEAANVERAKLGYETMHLVGWAATPYYDKDKKVLHWAKEYSVEGNKTNTLNYDVRVLGRKGVLSLNAVGGMDDLATVQQRIPSVLNMASFNSGYTYKEFDSGIDKVAAWTIGGLVAGKILAKVGFLALIIKAWKIIVLAVAAAWAAIKRFITGKKKEQEPQYEEPPVTETT